MAELFADDFNRADGDLNAGADWTKAATSVSTNLIISSNSASAPDSSTEALSYVSTQSEIGDQYAEVQITAAPNTARPGILLRCQAQAVNANTYFLYHHGSFNELRIAKFVNGTLTTIAQEYSLFVSVPYTMRAEAVGSTIRGFIDDVEVLSVVDTEFTEGYFGLGLSRSSGSSFLFDNFAGGDFVTNPDPEVTTTDTLQPGAEFTLTATNYASAPVSPVTLTDSQGSTITVPVTISGSGPYTAVGTMPTLAEAVTAGTSLLFGDVTIELST